MHPVYWLIILVLYAAAIFVAFRMGYQAGKKEERLVNPIPDFQIPDDVEFKEPQERELSHNEILEDMRLARTILQGYDN